MKQIFQSFEYKLQQIARYFFIMISNIKTREIIIIPNFWF